MNFLTNDRAMQTDAQITWRLLSLILPCLPALVPLSGRLDASHRPRERAWRTDPTSEFETFQVEFRSRIVAW
ncbi:hypothetical protein UC34_09275 [Pandoraea vervacti]|uniref:Secreted protein n=1 Tax=Pandoraea vervacti TaxID=656178 RepID=A0ABM5SX91_9BURK|nr:hypothetical protein UC34_09275 [Pandoraea vervacti]